MTESARRAADSDPANRAAASRRIAELAIGPSVLASMLPAFLLLARCLGKRRGWYAGLALYWVTWCTAVPLMLAGRDGVKAMFRPARRDPAAAMLAALPPLVSAFGGAAVGGAGSRRESVALVCTAFGNGLAEEVLWRGLFAVRHPEGPWQSVIWPSVWFGVWHLAPGIAAADARRAPRLAAGAFVLGLAYGTVARRTRSIRWTVASHTLAGLGLVASARLSRR